MQTYRKTNIEILKLLGEKIKEIRVTKNISQSKLSELSGVSVRRIGDIESGENHSALILIQLLRSLNSINLLEPFFAEISISPIEYAKFKSKTKQRHRASRVTKDNNPLNEDELW